jgi:predicted  nucleic acid-binding Zn-ribbon protein
MDKKTKKRLEVLRPKLQQLKRLLADARQQQDEPDEVRNLEAEIHKVEQEVAKLTGEG